MSKFKVGDVIKCINGDGWEEFKTGEELTVTESDESSFTIKGKKIYVCNNDFVLAEDHSTWHPHHDVIVAWAKGAKIRGRANNRGSAWRVFTLKDVPLWDHDWEYEVISEPDHTAEIAEIEQEMRKLADRLEKLK